jgi:hypothetical protein
MGIVVVVDASCVASTRLRSCVGMSLPASLSCEGLADVAARRRLAQLSYFALATTTGLTK